MTDSIFSSRLSRRGFLSAAAVSAASLTVSACSTVSRSNYIDGPAPVAPQVSVTAVHNAAELDYPGFLRSFGKLKALLPPEPRHVGLLPLTPQCVAHRATVWRRGS